MENNVQTSDIDRIVRESQRFGEVCFILDKYIAMRLTFSESEIKI